MQEGGNLVKVLELLLKVDLHIFHKQLMLKRFELGTGGRTRTDTTFKGPRILSPVRLPFRHTGKRSERP